MPSILLRVAISVMAAVAVLAAAPGDDARFVEVEETFVDAGPEGWTIGNGLIRYRIGPDGGTGFAVGAIEQPETGRDWNRGTTTDAFFRLDGQRVHIGAPQTPFVRAEAGEWSGGVRLALTYRIGTLDVTRWYACYPDSAVIETWTTYHQTGTSDVSLADLAGFSLSILNGTLNWISGLGNPGDASTPFERLWGDLDDGQRFDLGSDRRASEQSMTWFSVRADDEEFFGTMLWSGSWRFHAERRGDRIAVELGLPAFSTVLSAGGSLETPHAVFGITGPTAIDTSVALRGFIDSRLRPGRPLRASVTYNTWYSSGTFVDEASMLAEMGMAAAIGVEQFVIDAGWWLGANQDDPGDFITNWGNWTVDTERFPRGLQFLSERAHALGLRFGVWVEPERVDRATVGRPGLAEERFLATDDDSTDRPADEPEPGRRRARPRVPTAPVQPGQRADGPVSAQVCLVDSAARAWLFGKLVAFLEETRPDYLKWDNNLWVNCTRAGHGHGREDANFLHHAALATMFDQLREHFPDLDIENCGGGGTRLSLDMLARTDAAWMDDRTGHAARTRHEVQGLLALLPPSYLLSFALTGQETAGESHVADAAYVLRSRMLGAPGVSWLLSTVDPGSLAEAARQIALYKRLRPFQVQGTALLLSAQVRPDDATSWDAVEFLLPGGQGAAVMAFNAFDAPPIARLRLRGLRRDATYDVESADAGILGEATGADLMTGGVELQKADAALGHIIFLTAR